MHNLSLGTECPMLETNVPSWGRTNERTNEWKKLSIERSASVKNACSNFDQKHRLFKRKHKTKELDELSSRSYQLIVSKRIQILTIFQIFILMTQML